MIDTSAIVAVLFDEPEAAALERLIEADQLRLVSAVTRVEATCVVEGREREVGRSVLERLCAATAAGVVPIDAAQVEIACAAFRRYGRGRHPAALNIGDCFACALAKSSSEPLLFKGAGFAATDFATAA